MDIARGGAAAALALVCLAAQEREQKRRLFAPARGQNSTPHHSQTTTVPNRCLPRRDALACRIASRPAGEKTFPAAKRAAVAFAGSLLSRKTLLRGSRSRALSASTLLVDSATSPRRPRPWARRYSVAVTPCAL